MNEKLKNLSFKQMVDLGLINIEKQDIVFIMKKVIRSKKEYTCDFCEKTINKNEKYTRVFAKEDGEPTTFRLCACCSLKK